MTEDWMPERSLRRPRRPAAREREQRRREREEKRRAREAKRAGKEGKREAGGLAVTTAGGSIEPSAEPPGEAPVAAPVLAPRGPEEEFWDEEPAPDEEPAVGEGPAVMSSRRSSSAVRGPSRQGAAGRRRGPAGLPRRRPGSGRGVFAAIGRHPFRLVGAIVAVLVLWFLFALFQPFHGDGSGRVAVTIPKGASVSEVGDLLDEKGVGLDSSTLFQIRVTLAGKRSDLYPGRFTLAQDMCYGAAIDALSKPRRSRRTTTVTIPEGYSRAQAAPAGRRRRPRRQLHEGDACSSKYLEPGRVRRQGRQEPRGLPLPRHLRTEAARAGRRPGPAAARRLQAADQGRRHELREVEEPDRLRRAHDRLDDRARGAACRSSASWSPR